MMVLAWASSLWFQIPLAIVLAVLAMVVVHKANER